jgi:predicted Ser/Thr protein kinase
MAPPRVKPKFACRVGLRARALALAGFGQSWQHRAMPRTIGGYQVLRRIASGGMGSVYLGVNRGPGGFARLVALKQLHPFLELGDEARRRFTTEACIGAELRHPGIVAVQDFDRDEDGFYLVMEYVHGRNLRQLLRDHGALGPRVAARVIREVVAALEAAHGHVDAQGRPSPVIHRDLTPTNVLVSEQGEVKITDFGIARVAGSDVSRHSGLRGTVAYMSPEQARGDALDPRTDLYSAGLVLLELCRGQRAYRAESELEQLRLAQRGLDFDELAAAAAGPLLPALTGALQPDPERRYPSATTMREALDQVLEQLGRPTREDLAALVRPQLEPLEEVIAVAEEATRATVELGQPPPEAPPAPERARRSRGPLVAGLLVAGAVLGAIALLPPPPDAVVLIRDAAPPALDAPKPRLDAGEKWSASDAVSPGAVVPDASRRPARRRGVLVVNTLPVWSRVFVDGRAVGNTPATLHLRPGRRRILLRPAGRRPPVSFSVTIRPGRAIRRIIDVSP